MLFSFPSLQGGKPATKLPTAKPADPIERKRKQSKEEQGVLKSKGRGLLRRFFFTVGRYFLRLGRPRQRFSSLGRPRRDLGSDLGPSDGIFRDWDGLDIDLRAWDDLYNDFQAQTGLGTALPTIFELRPLSGRPHQRFFNLGRPRQFSSLGRPRQRFFELGTASPTIFELGTASPTIFKLTPASDGDI